VKVQRTRNRRWSEEQIIKILQEAESGADLAITSMADILLIVNGAIGSGFRCLQLILIIAEPCESTIQ
jgi:hypothetical protein